MNLYFFHYLIAGIPLGDFDFTSEYAVQTAVTDEYGGFSFDGVIFGSYVVREIEAPRGYILNETLFLVTITEDGEVIKVEIENELIRGDIEGMKVGEDTEAPFEGVFVDADGLAGAVIGLFREDATEFTKEYAIQYVTTDEYGHFAFRDVIFGSFIVREIAPPTGYVRNDTAFPVRIDTDEQLIEVVIENTLIRGRVEGVKTGESTEGKFAGLFTDRYGLEGALIGLFGLVEELEAEQPDNEADEDERGEGEPETETSPTSENGENDADGDYNNGADQDEQEESDEDETAEPEMQNPSIGGIPLDEFEFTTENALMTAITSEGGSFSFSELVFGSYVLREIEAPHGYVLNETLYLVTIRSDGEVVKVEIENRLIRGSVEGIKLDADEEEPLAGAVFGLFHEGETAFARESALMIATSAADGRFAFENLPFGTFQVVEIEAPEGFIRSDEVFEVEITEDGQIIRLAVENEPEPKTPDDPKEPDPTPTPTPTPTPNRPGTSAPQTGDETSLPWLVLILSGLGIAALGFVILKLHGKDETE